MPLLPFDSPDFRSDDLEEFVTRFLSAGVSLAVDGPDGVEEKRVLRAHRANKCGGVAEGGIDVVARVQGGETWAFQCKLKTRGSKRKWTAGESRKAIEEATYPADRYFLVVVCPTGHSRGAEDLIEARQDWVFWDQDTLASQFLTRVPLESGLRILEEFFSREVASAAYGSRFDGVLLTASQFFGRLLDEARPFNHATPLVGARETLERLHAFVADPGKKAVIVKGSGGVGKSRLLCEFAKEFAERHPGRELRFIGLAMQDEPESSLGYLLKRGLVAVHEDAHRTETLRPALLAAIAKDKRAKLVLTARPQGVAAVRRALHRFGIDTCDFEPDLEVGRLGDPDMVRLAKAVLGSPPAVEPRTLAEWSGGSPLVCTVGGRLIGSGTLCPAAILNSETFRTEVFARFEEQNLESLAEGNPAKRDLLKKLLRCLAVLAPFPADPEPEAALARFLDLRGSELEELLGELVVAEVITKTRQGWRVGPDLFADHLVFTSCVREGRRSTFCQELTDEFGDEHSAAMLRNLAEAEWRARQGGTASADLTGPLSNRFEKRFTGGSFAARRGMLGSWATYSVFLPERSIELAKLAIRLSEAPADMIDGVFPRSASSHRDVLAAIPPVLEPIGIYHIGHQPQTFDLLAQLGRDLSQGGAGPELANRNHPWTVIGKSAGFAHGHSRSIDGVLRWLESRLGADRMAHLIDQRCSFLSAVLGPVFDRVIEGWYQDGEDIGFRTVRLHVEATAPARDSAFRLIETKVMPRSEVAAINLIPMLGRTAAFYGVGPDAQTERAPWRPVRLEAVRLLAQCLGRWPTPFVGFAVWRSLADWVVREGDPEVAGAGKSVVASVPRDLPMRLAFATLGDGWGFPTDLGLGGESGKRLSGQEWIQFTSRVAGELLKRYSGDGDLFEHLAAFDEESRSRGFVPNWSPLLAALARSGGALARNWIGRMLDGPATFADRSLGTLVALAPGAGPEQTGEWLARALHNPREPVRDSALNTMCRPDSDPAPAVKDAMLTLTRSPEAEPRRAALQALGVAVSHDCRWALGLVSELDLQVLDDAEFASVIDGLAKAASFEEAQFEIGFLKPLLARLVNVRWIGDEPFPGFLDFVAGRFPEAAYQLFRDRIERIEAGCPGAAAGSFWPVVNEMQPRPIPGLEKTEGFDEVVRFLGEKIRRPEGPASRYWESLFQSAVLMTERPKGIRVLRGWLSEAADIDEVARIAEVLSFRGGQLVFREPEFLRGLLEAASVIAPGDDRVESALVPCSAMRSYTNGLLDPEHRHLLEEARKASSRFASDPVLKPFFDRVVGGELRDQEWHRKVYGERVLARQA